MLFFFLKNRINLSLSIHLYLEDVWKFEVPQKKRKAGERKSESLRLGNGSGNSNHVLVVISGLDGCTLGL